MGKNVKGEADNCNTKKMLVTYSDCNDYSWSKDKKAFQDFIFWFHNGEKVYWNRIGTNFSFQTQNDRKMFLSFLVARW